MRWDSANARGAGIPTSQIQFMPQPTTFRESLAKEVRIQELFAVTAHPNIQPTR
jgi:hypothetical protein